MSANGELKMENALGENTGTYFKFFIPLKRYIKNLFSFGTFLPRSVIALSPRFSNSKVSAYNSADD
jgi:hypothetical protein